MPKFLVHFQRQRPEYATIEIQAYDEDAAEEEAFEYASNHDLDWTASSEPEDWEIDEVEPQPDDESEAQ
jgi:hypothetical protein